MLVEYPRLLDFPQDLTPLLAQLRQEVAELRAEVPRLRGEVARLQRENLELRQQVGYWKGMHAQALRRLEELQREVEQLRGKNKKLQALRFGKKRHWPGLTCFVDDLRIPMDNNASERKVRGPAVGRKNYWGSGALGSGRLAAMGFSLFANLGLWKLNPRRWLTWYLQSCAQAGGAAPADISSFLPGNMSPEQLATLAIAPSPETAYKS